MTLYICAWALPYDVTDEASIYVLFETIYQFFLIFFLKSLLNQRINRKSALLLSSGSSPQKLEFKIVHDGDNEPKQAPEEMCSEIKLQMTSKTGFEGTVMLWDYAMERRTERDEAWDSIKVRKSVTFVGMDAV